MARMLLLLWLVTLPLRGNSQTATLSLAFDDMPVAQILQALAEHQRINMVLAPGVSGSLSLHLTEVSPKQALTLVLRMAGLTEERQGNVRIFLPRQQRQLQLEEQQKRQLLQQPLLIRPFSLQFANASDIAASLNAQQDKLLSLRGSVIVDKRTNRLLVRDNAAVLNRVADWVQQMDIPVAQVEIQAHIVTISQESLRELGVKWGLTGESTSTATPRLSSLGTNLAVATPAISAGFSLTRINGQMLELELSALEQKNQLSIIASPRLLTAHQQPASIKQGTEIPYQVSSGSSGATSFEFKEAVLGMDVTPTVHGKDHITLKLHLSQNMPGRSIKQADGEALAIDKQEIDTQVTVKDGETLALGGIFQRQHSQDTDQVPFLGDVPGFGNLFKHDAKKSQRRELVIFITPRLSGKRALFSEPG